MKKNEKPTSENVILHRKAEKLFKNKPLKTESNLTENERLSLLHELQAHQIELEMQNEELRKDKDKIEKTLRKYTELFDFAPTGYFTLSKTGEIVEINFIGAKRLGKNRSELINSNFELFVSNETRSVFNSFLQNIFDNKSIHSCELLLSPIENLPVYVYLSGIPGNSGEECFITMVDISEKKQIEQALKVSEANNKNFILQTAMDGFWLVDKHGKLLEVNENYCKMSGYSEHELLSMHISDLEYVESEDETIVHIQKTINEGEDRFETCHRRKDGTIVEVEINVHYQLVNGGRFVAFLRDITERKRIEEQLLENEYKYRSLFEESNDAIFLVDLTTGYYIDCNHMAEKLTGYALSEIIQMKTGAFLPPNRKAELRPNIDIILEDKELRGETEIISGNGDIIPVEFNSSIVIVNKKQCILSMLRDISARRATEEALKKSEERVKFKLQRILSPSGSIAELDLDDIIDAQAIQKLMEHFFELAQIPMAIVDVFGKVLVGVGGQDICQKFHRVHPNSCRNCVESDLQLTHGIQKGDFKLYKCKNNMWDMVTPLIIGGEHKGNLFIGQFFVEDEQINNDIFKKQAHQYNYEEREYMNALDKVPRISRYKLEHAKLFFLFLAQSISQLSYSNIKLARSIKQQKKVNNKFRENEKLLNKTQEIAHLGSWSIDLDQNILMWSDEMYNIFGVDRHEFSGNFEGFLECIHPEDRDIVYSAYKDSITEGKSGYDIEHRIISKETGEFRHIFEKCEHIKDTSGKIIRSVGMALDITERKQSAEILREKERLFRESQTAAKIGSYSTDLVLKTWKGTKAIYEIFGIDETYPHTIDGWLYCIHPDFREQLVHDLYTKKENENTYEHEYKIIRINDGKERWVYGIGKFEYDKQLNPIRLIGTIQDITVRKQAEESLKQLNDDLEIRVKERTEELLTISGEVEERERNRFSLELHDDLGPLLSATKLYFQWLSETRDPEKKKIIIEKGNTSIEKAIQTTRRISHGLSSQIVNELGFIGAIQNFTENINDTEKLKIDLKYNSNQRFGNFLEILLYRTTTELINNTLKYAQATYIGIDFNFNKEKNIINFIFFDDGNGFNLADVENANKGLGLMTIQQRIKLMGGTINIKTGIGNGMKVYIEMPVVDEINPDLPNKEK